MSDHDANSHYPQPRTVARPPRTRHSPEVDPPADRTERFPFSLRTDRSRSRDAHPTLPDIATPRLACTPARLAVAGPASVPFPRAGVAELECWSSRRTTAQNPSAPTAHRAKCPHTNRELARPFSGTADRE